MGSKNEVVFEDLFPTMLERLGAEGFMKELENGFHLLMDEEKGLITFESLKRKAKLMGLQEMGDDEIMCMLREGDLNGDGVLDEMEFFTLMFRLSPGLMSSFREWIMQIIASEI